MSDLTETAAAQELRRRLEGGAEISDDELRMVIEASRELLVIASFEGFFLLLSPAWETALGYTRDELRAKPFIEFVHPEDRGKTDVVAARLRPGVDLLSFTNRYVAKDGSIRHISWRGMVSVGAQRYYMAAADSTAALRRNEAADAMDALCELAPTAVVMQTAQGKITRWDGRAETWFGWSSASMEGKEMREYLRDEDGEPTDLLTLADRGDDDIGVQLRTPDGDCIDAVAQIRTFGDGSTPMTGAVATLTPRGGD